jgi:hypothetical protein
MNRTIHVFLAVAAAAAASIATAQNPPPPDGPPSRPPPPPRPDEQRAYGSRAGGEPRYFGRDERRPEGARDPRGDRGPRMDDGPRFRDDRRGRGDREYRREMKMQRREGRRSDFNRGYDRPYDREQRGPDQHHADNNRFERQPRDFAGPPPRDRFRQPEADRPGSFRREDQRPDGPRRFDGPRGGERREFDRLDFERGPGQPMRGPQDFGPRRGVYDRTGPDEYNRPSPTPHRDFRRDEGQRPDRDGQRPQEWNQRPEGYGQRQPQFDRREQYAASMPPQDERRYREQPDRDRRHPSQPYIQ